MDRSWRWCIIKREYVIVLKTVVCVRPPKNWASWTIEGMADHLNQEYGTPEYPKPFNRGIVQRATAFLGKKDLLKYEASEWVVNVTKAFPLALDRMAGLSARDEWQEIAQALKPYYRNEMDPLIQFFKVFTGYQTGKIPGVKNGPE